MATSNARQFPLGMRAGARAGLVTVVRSGMADGDFESGEGDNLWICPPGMRYRLIYFGEVHKTKSGTASVHGILAERCVGTEAPGAGDDLLSAGPSLLGDVDVPQFTGDGTVALNAAAVAGTLDFTSGNRLSYVAAATGNPDNTAGVCITAILMPIGDVRHQIIP